MMRFVVGFMLLSASTVYATEPLYNNTNNNNSSSTSSTTSYNNNTNAMTNNNSTNSSSSSTGVGGNVSSASSSGPSTSSAVSTSDANLSANGAGANSNNITLNQNYRTPRSPVTTAFAASLTSGIDTCLGSGSGGVQTQMLGVSVGKTLTDENCVMIKQVQLLREMGLNSAACFRARAGKEGAAIDAAMTAAGVDCSELDRPVVVAPPVVENFNHVARPELDNYVTKPELAEHEKRITKGLSKK